MLRRVATVAILLLAACSGDDGDGDASQSPTSDTTTTTSGESSALATIDTGAGTCSMARSGDLPRPARRSAPSMASATRALAW